MSDVARALDVWCFEEKAGKLTEAGGGTLSFTYDPAWIAADLPPLSFSLPLSGAYDSNAVEAFFGGLLPEGDIRELVAGEFGISSDNAFSLLDAIGGDCAGAVSLYRQDAPPAEHVPGVDWLTEPELDELLAALPRCPMVTADGEGYRLSLAGAQDKFPAVIEDGRIGLPRGRQPSTHIVKAPISWLPDTVPNEAFCLAVGRRLGIHCAEALPRLVGSSPVLIVTRYDRATGEDGRTRRLHQEDFCQALGIPSANKYESEGGPSLVDCAELVRAVSTDAVGDLLGLIDCWALSFLVGNHDAHGKNYSILYGPGSARLAPAYDIISSISYLAVAKVDKKMAMKVGGSRKPDWLNRDHLDAFLGQARLGKAPTRRRLHNLASRAPGAVEEVRDEFIAEGWWSKTLDRVVQTFAARSRKLTELCE